MRTPGVLASLATLVAAAAASACTPRTPVEIELRLDAGRLHYVLRAHADAWLHEASWVPAAPALPVWTGVHLVAGDSLSGSATAPTGTDRIQVRVWARTATGLAPVESSTQAPPSRPAPPVTVHAVPAARKSASVAPAPGAWITARFVYQDRLLDRGGYTGRVQILPLRHVDVDLVEASTDSIVASGSLDEEGRVRLGPVGAGTTACLLRLRSSTRRQARYRIAVVEPGAGGPASARTHGFSTQPFDVTGDVDLGRVVLHDADGFGTLQAFHILDTALDAWDAVAAFGSAPGPGDSLRLVWGPSLRLRGSAYGNGVIEVTSPGSGDTDGWSDAVLLHEVGHFAADRWLRDDNPGGLHLLGDVEQDLALAYSEGLATTFACWVRMWRGGARRNEAGEPMDADFAAFVNAGLPPPENAPGGLQFVWDVEVQTLNGAALPLDGIGSETNVAGAIWDLLDGTATDDDGRAEPPQRVWAVLRAMRALPAEPQVTFEDFWRTWRTATSDPEALALADILRRARIEFEPDAAEPDLPPHRPAYLWTDRFREAEGGVVLTEVVFSPRIAVEITNRSTEMRDLGGFGLVARSNASSANPSLTYTIPSGFMLAPGARVVVHRGGRARDNGARDLYTELWTAPWFPETDGALALVDAAGAGVDFLRWDGPATPSTVAPPPGTSWTGTLHAAGYGRALSRRTEIVDRDAAGDFAAAAPTLGLPNDTPSLHRTFFPEEDVDILRWAIVRDGAYTLQLRRLRNGAAPRVDLFDTNLGEPLASLDFNATSQDRLTLYLNAGEEVEARFRHAGGRTRFGTYDVALVEEGDARAALPPAGLRVRLAGAGATRTLFLAWRNAALYDSLRLRAGDRIAVLPGGARSWEAHLALGPQPVTLEAFSRGLVAAAPPLLVAVSDWPPELREDFESLDNWERTGTWALRRDAARGGILASSADGPYVNDSDGTLRLRSAVLAQESTVLSFEHACLVRPEDVATLESSTDWGATWQRLARYDWNATPAWRDASLDAGDWQPVNLSLGHLSGSPVQLRFRLETDGHGRAPGWFVDGLRITPEAAPLHLRLDQNVPNPFNPTTRIAFELSRPAAVVLRILDVRGGVVRTLLDGWHAAGRDAIDWDGRDMRGRRVASGVYVYELRAGYESRSRKLVIVR